MPESEPRQVEIKVTETVYKLDWAEVENRVRSIVSELQEQLHRQALEQQEELEATNVRQSKLSDDIKVITEAVFFAPETEGEQPTVNKRNNAFYEFIERAQELKSRQAVFEIEMN